MAKVKLPLLSAEARGELAKSMIYQQQKYGGAIVKRYAIPRVGQAASQLLQRAAYRTALDGWNILSDNAKEAYRDRARLIHLLGINLYLRENIGTATWVIGQGVIGQAVIA